MLRACLQAGARGRGLMGVCRALAHSQTLPFPAFDVSGGASVDRAAPGGCGWATSGWDARRHLHGSSPKLRDEDRIRRTRNAESFGASSGRDDNEAAGWSYEEACTIPNLISLSRALSAPVLGYCIVTEAWPIAIGGTLVAGFSDWLDGYLAKRMKSQESSLGSYLDPLADKVLVTCLTIATGYKGLIDPVVCGVIIGRDVVLLGGAFIHRAHVLNWRWKNWREYFRVTKPSEGSNAAPAAPNVKPIFLSKVNTLFQIGLVVGAMAQGASLGYPSQEVVQGLGYLTAGTTVASGAIYVRMYFRGQMLT